VLIASVAKERDRNNLLAGATQRRELGAGVLGYKSRNGNKKATLFR
jgi:hypothetical protein